MWRNSEVESAHTNDYSLATLIVNGRLINMPLTSIDGLLDDLIAQELDQSEFLQGRTYLIEALSPQLNNLYQKDTSTLADSSSSPPTPLRQALV